MKTLHYNKYFNNKKMILDMNDFINVRDSLLYLIDMYYINPYTGILEDIQYLFNLINTEYYPKDFSLWYGLSGIKMIHDNSPIRLFDEKSYEIIEYYIIREARIKIEKYKKNHIFKELDMFSGVIGMIRALIESSHIKYRNEINSIIIEFSKIFITSKEDLDNIFSNPLKNNKRYLLENIDLSISHGATSCLMILYLSYVNGFKSKTIIDAIKILFYYIYNNITDKNGDIRDIALINRTKRIKMNSKLRKYTWCYGTLTVIYVLSIVSTLLNIEEDKIVNNMLINELRNIKLEYLNNNLFICHGKSGLKLLLILLKNENSDLVNEKMEEITKIKNGSLIYFENKNRKNCILTGNLSVRITEYIEKANSQDALIYKMLLLK